MNLKELTEICATTQWEHHTAYKYLTIAKYALILSNKATEESITALENYEVVSKALCDIMLMLKKRLDNSVTEPLS